MRSIGCDTVTLICAFFGFGVFSSDIAVTIVLMCVWDCGSSLSLAYGADRAHKVGTEDEAKVTLNWYGRHQPEKDFRCPRCGEMMWGPKARHALSRYAAITVCDRCGCEEALECAGMVEKRPLMKWCAIVLSSIGGGTWRR